MDGRKLRIAHIAPPWFAIPPRDYGGTENVISTLTEGLVQRGHAVTLFATGDSITSANLWYIWSKDLISMQVPWTDSSKAKKHIQDAFQYAIRENKNGVAGSRYNFDIIHVHLSSAADIFLFELASLSPIPIVATLHSRFPFDRRENHIGEDDAFYLKWAHSLPLIAISQYAKKDALQHVIEKISFAGVIPHGLNSLNFDQGEKKDRDILTWIGRVTPDKGTHHALEVAVKLKQKIIFAGIIDKFLSSSQDYYLKKIKPLMDAYPEYITYIGKVNRIEKAKLLQRSLVFLNPIVWEEPFGLVVIEAMAQGCPVISFKRGAMAEIIKPGINGDFAKDTDEMAQKVLPVIQNIDRNKLVQWTKDNYSDGKMILEYEKTYQEVIASFHKNASFKTIQTEQTLKIA